MFLSELETLLSVAFSYLLLRHISLLPLQVDSLSRWFVLYSGFFPFLSLAQAFIDSLLFFFARLGPISTLTVSVLLSIGWIVQISL